jgi:hypothetical protein
MDLTLVPVKLDYARSPQPPTTPERSWLAVRWIRLKEFLCAFMPLWLLLLIPAYALLCWWLQNR